MLRDYPQNQELVRNLGSRYYQVVYPTQVRQREKFGVSTREIDKSYSNKVQSPAKVKYSKTPKSGCPNSGKRQNPDAILAMRLRDKRSEIQIQALS